MIMNQVYIVSHMAVMLGKDVAASSHHGHHHGHQMITMGITRAWTVYTIQKSIAIFPTSCPYSVAVKHLNCNLNCTHNCNCIPQLHWIRHISLHADRELLRSSVLGLTPHQHGLTRLCTLFACVTVSSSIVTHRGVLAAYPQTHASRPSCPARPSLACCMHMQTSATLPNSAAACAIATYACCFRRIQRRMYVCGALHVLHTSSPIGDHHPSDCCASPTLQQRSCQGIHRPDC